MSQMLDPVTRNHVRQAADALAAEFAGVFSQETIERYIAESVDLLGDSKVNVFVPVLAHRFARERLKALAQLEGLMIQVRSAGSDPGEEINPAVVAAMEEVGVDMSEEFPKPLTDEVVRAADAVVTMGCGDACPIYPGKRYEDWTLDDPAGQDLDTVRRIRDEIDDRVRTLIDELLD